MADMYTSHSGLSAYQNTLGKRRFFFFLLPFITQEVKNVNNRTVCKHFVIFLVVYLISHVYVLSVLMQLET